MLSHEQAARELILAFRSDRNYLYFSTLAVQSDELFRAILHLCMEKNYPFPQYSSWLVSHVAKNHLEKLLPFQEEIIDFVLICEDHSAQRNLISALKQLPFTEYKSGELLDRMFYFLMDSDAKVALKVYALEMLIPFVKIYPEIKSEIDLIIQKESEYQTPAFRSGAKKIQKQMEK